MNSQSGKLPRQLEFMAYATLALASQAFLDHFPYYIRIDVSCKQIDIDENPHEFLNEIHSRIAALCYSITSQTLPNSKLSHLVSWPSLFVTCIADAFISRDVQQDRGSLLVGILDASESDLLALTEKLSSWTSDVRTANFFIDYIPVPLFATYVVKREELGLLIPDEWMLSELTAPTRLQGYTVHNSGTNDREEIENYEDEDITAQFSIKARSPQGSAARMAMRKDQAPAAVAAEHVHGDALQMENRKLTPAHAILNRLKWDASLPTRDFIIVYEDRHDGLMENSLGNWTSESTEETFIPAHRIRGVKKADNGKTVWHRVARIDEISSIRG